MSSKKAKSAEDKKKGIPSSNDVSQKLQAKVNKTKSENNSHDESKMTDDKTKTSTRNSEYTTIDSESSKNTKSSKKVTFDLHQESHRKQGKKEDGKKVDAFLQSYPASVLETFDKKEIQDIKEQFNKYKDGSGTITDTMADLLVRSYGYNPSEQYLIEGLHKVDPSGRGKLNEVNFLVLMADMKCTLVDNAEMIEIFRVFDPDNTGFIQVEEMVAILSTMGESLEKAEMDEFVKQADLAGTGKINYESLVERMHTILEYKYNIDLRRIIANRFKRQFIAKAKRQKKLAKKMSEKKSRTSTSTISRDSSESV